jgi:hypothetical protein
MPLFSKLLPPALAAYVTWLLFPTFHTSAISIFGLIWLLFHIYMNKETSHPMNLLGMLSRYRRTFAALGAAAALLVGSLVIVPRAKSVIDYFRSRAAILKKTDIEAPNFGVSPKIIRIPVIWTPPSSEGGVVVRVRKDKKDFTPNDILVAYAPLDEHIFMRLLEANAHWDAVYGGELIPEKSIKTAGIEHPEALVTIQTDLSEGSIDYKINDKLTTIEHALIDYRRAKAHAKSGAAVADDEKHPITPFQIERMRLRLEKLGTDMTSLLLDRTERTISPARDFHVFDGAGIVTEGTSIPDDKPTQLMVQEIQDDRFLQIRMTPDDARAFLQQIHHPDGAAIRLREQATSRIENIPLSEVKEIVRPDDPGFKDLVASSDFNGPPSNNPAMGISKTVKVSMIVGHQLPETAYFFDGVFDRNGSRLLENAANVAIGEVSLLQNNPSGPPHSYGLKPLQLQLAGMTTLLAGNDALIQKIDRYHKDYPEKVWAVDLRGEMEKDQKTLRGEIEILQASIDAKQKTGVSGDVQPKFPYRFGHSVFDQKVPNALTEEALLVLSPNGTVTIRVTFFANVNALPVGGVIQAQPFSESAPIDFRITDVDSQDRNNDLVLYTSEATLPLAEARKLFPPNQPMVDSYIVIPLQAKSGSHLTVRELAKATAWTAFFSLLGHYVFGHADLFAWGLGLGLAVAFHEFLGHGWRAWRYSRRMKIPVRIRWSWKEGLFWQEKKDSHGWQMLTDPGVRAAGPSVSEWTLRAAVLLLPLQFFLSSNLHGVIFIISLVVSSLIFRRADQPAGITSAPHERQDDPSNLPPSGAAPLIQKMRNYVRTPLAESERETLLESLRDTVFEYEHYYYPGDETTYVAWYQAPLLLTSRKIKLTPRMIFQRRFQRDNVNWLEGLILGA